ncbi:hypothetical protein OKA04_18170 [Luteolibacter flavescens]|uniref:Uncharacterized protein n=1 Tax=Luteolibacter flavescens TaxID=1859460 RepID=A0ABT3FSX0_9BACT|nr:hypothetical protein [Luteolibacter flavescens]MCW1886670.1 hypothetical protein [Luteolibacter flavescens]
MNRFLLALSLISPAFGMQGAKMDSLRLPSGKEYRAVTITRVSPAEIGITHESGATTIKADLLSEAMRREIWPPKPEPEKKESPYAQAEVSFKTSASEKAIHEELMKFMTANPKATVLALTIRDTGPKARQHHRIVFDRSKGKLLVMRRTEPRSLDLSDFHTWTCFHVGEAGFKTEIPWIDEKVFSYSKYPADPRAELPLSYPEEEDLVQWP